MGFFDFLKPKKKTQNAPTDLNAMLLHSLKARIESMGNTVEFSTQYAAIIVNSEIEIATAALSGDFHPLMFPALVITINQTYFPQGIEASLVGLGNNNEAKVEALVKDYISNIFTPIIDSFKDSHNESDDFTSTVTGTKILWHPKMSPDTFQGTWQETTSETRLFDVLKNALEKVALPQKINSLKLYVARQPSGELSLECSLNNEQWHEGLLLLENYAKTWKDLGEFKAQKQFIMLRRCDAFD